MIEPEIRKELEQELSFAMDGEDAIVEKQILGLHKDETLIALALIALLRKKL